MIKSAADPKISIIIPAYNAERFIEETVESVFNQTYSNWELVIVNDGSTDGTSALLWKMAQVDDRVKVVTKHNGGLGRARNTGISECDPSTTYLIFLDADDLWVPDTLVTLLATLEKHPECFGAHGIAELVDVVGQTITPYMETEYRRMALQGRTVLALTDDEPTGFMAIAYLCCVMTAGAVLLRKSEIARVAGFDTNVTPVEDLDLWLRLMIDGNMAFTRKIVIKYRQHAGGLSKNRRAMLDGARRVRRKLLATHELTSQQQRALRISYAAAELSSARTCLSMCIKSIVAGDLNSSLPHAQLAVENLWHTVRGL